MCLNCEQCQFIGRFVLVWGRRLPVGSQLSRGFPLTLGGFREITSASAKAEDHELFGFREAVTSEEHLKYGCSPARDANKAGVRARTFGPSLRLRE